MKMMLSHKSILEFGNQTVHTIAQRILIGDIVVLCETMFGEIFPKLIYGKTPLKNETYRGLLLIQK